MSQEGRLLPSDLLWHPQYPDKVSAQQVRGLFGATTQGVSTTSPIYPQQIASNGPHNKEQNIPSRSPACPHCNQTDTVLPASKASISVPLKPSDTNVKVVKIWRWIFGSIFGFLVIALLGGLLLGGCTALLAGSQDETGLTSLVGGSMLLPLCCIGPVVLTIGGGIGILIPWLAGRYVNQNYQRRFDQWQKAMEKYKKLWFCSRCAGVWIDGQNRIVPLEHIQSFLYEIQPTEPGWPL